MPYYIKKPKKKKEKPLPLFDKAGIKIKKKPDLVAKLDKVFSRYIRPHALTRTTPTQNAGRATDSVLTI